MHNLVADIFQKHYDYYGTVGVETIKQQAGQVEQVTGDYQGRVIYELLQNAFDKAETRIKVMVKNGNLYMANDGERFTYRHAYDYKDGADNRGDFQALCSISTSGKDVNTSIGNKGVGFKSVFSVSSGGYADIHTEGEVIGKRGKVLTEPISFRIYDTFTNPKDLPKLLKKPERDTLRAQIVKSKANNKNKGVPGYYYPIYLERRGKEIQRLFDEGFVTIIHIPLPNSGHEKLVKFFQEIEPINFHFVQLRVLKEIVISFEFEDEPELCFTRTLKPKISATYFSAHCNDQLKALAIKARIDLDEPKVAVYFKSTTAEYKGHGKLYNYLPTTQPAPFTWVDFHADFHTTVDRTGINLEGAIGEYNRALSEACAELYFHVINSYLPLAERMNLDIRFIDSRALPEAGSFMLRWHHLSPDGKQSAYHTVRRILRMGSGDYQTGAGLIARLAFRYFSQTARDVAAHKDFFDHNARFIEEFTRQYGQSHQLPKDFKRKLAEELKRLDAPVIPRSAGRTMSIREELIYREGWRDTEDSIIPNFIGLNITGFRIPDDDLERMLGVKNVIATNEVLKYYRQVSPTGKVRDKKEAYTENEQRHLLSSIAALIGRANDRRISTHRYQDYLASHTENTVANLANFSLSTIFLKVKTTGRGKLYKPAQLCQSEDIDLKFLPPLPPGMTQSYLLKYLGVSFSPGYLFVDKPIYDKLKKGLDHIPAIYKKPYEKADPLAYTQVAKDVRVVHYNKDIHPALINDNQYAFLTDWKRQEFYDESFHLLVKAYPTFPRIYCEQLIAAMKRVPTTKSADLLRFYPQVFDQMAKTAKTYMAFNQNQVFFSNLDQPVFIAANENEFRLSQLRDLPVLALFTRKVEPNQHGLKGTLLIFREQKLFTKGNTDATQEFHELLHKRMFYLLSEITRTSLGAGYFDNPDRIGELAKRLGFLRFERAELIQREVSSPHFNEPILDRRSYDAEDGCLYLLNDLSESGKAEAIAKVLLRAPNTAQTVELVLFHRTEQALEQAIRKNQAEEFTLFQKHWISDYEKRFAKFVKRITDALQLPYPKGDLEWNRYDRLHRSKLIQSVSDSGLLPQLKERVAIERARFEHGVFAYFKLEIDETMYDSTIARLRLILEPLTGEAASGLKRRLNTLIGRLGIDNKLAQLEADIRTHYPAALGAVVSSTVLQVQTAQVKLDASVSNIFQSIQNIKEKAQHQFTAGSTQAAKPLPVKTKKVIFQGSNLPGSSERSEDTGAGGEIDVLNLMIVHFLTLDTKERKKGLKAVHELILSKSKNEVATTSKHYKLYKECLAQVDNDEALTMALIPFCYITLHYKFAFVDLFAWYKGRAVMIEVKSTSTTGKHDFSISQAEVNEALQTEDYLLVRVTPDEIIFLGNPVYEVKSQFTQVSGGNFDMVPTAFNFKYKHE